MWKLLKILEQTYFIYCNFSDNTKDMTFMLYDFKQTFSQTLNIKDIKQKVKILNKRYDFNEDNIKEALTSDAIQSAFLEMDLDLESCLLKLKYSVKSCLLTYEWSLRKQNLFEFQQTFVQPLLLGLLGCHQQIEILTENIRKKDIELKQFRIEGAVLNRKTLVTKPFDLEEFNRNFEDCNKTAINFRDLAKFLKERDSKEKSGKTNEHSSVKKREEDIKAEGSLKEDQRSNTKISPKQKKRKAAELKLHHLQQHLKVRKRGLEYESSQSQTPSCGSSQTVEGVDKKDLELKQKTTTQDDQKPKEENRSSPRKSSRYTPVTNQKANKMSSNLKTDSDDDDYLRTLSQRKATRSTVNLQKDFDTNSDNEHIKSNSGSNCSEEKKQQNCKSLCLLETSAVKCIESSDVFDFSSESDDDVPLTQWKKNKNSKLLKKFNKNKLSSNTSTHKLNKTSNSVGYLPSHSDFTAVSSVISMRTPSLSKDLSQSATPVIIDEISSQLDNIRKELETLEAMRLADLKKRMCKV